MTKSSKSKMNKMRTTLTIQGDDAKLLNDLKVNMESKYNFKLSLIEVVRKALRELDKIERSN